MKIKEIMTPNVIIASPSDTLQHAAQMMEENDFGLLPVGDGDRLVGMLSDRDITVRAVAHGKAPDQCTVAEVMSEDVKFVYEDETLEDASRNMSELQVRRLPVLNRKKRLVGILSLGDLALNAKDNAGKALKDVSEPTGQAAA
jgi:CBS domain-containing protein